MTKTSPQTADLALNYGISEEVLVPIYSAIGELIFSWALVEANINYWIAIVYQRVGGKHLARNNGIPWGMKRKIRFLRECFNRISALSEFKQETIALLTRAKAVVKTRDIIAHGVIAEYKPKTMEMLFVQIDLDKTKTMQRFSETWISIAKILGDSGDAIAIGRESLALTEKLLKTFLTDDKSQQLFANLFSNE